MDEFPSKGDYERLAEFRYALRKFLRFSETAASQVGLPPHQHQALLAIEGYPGRDSINISELQERLQIAHHSAVGLVNRLSERNLIVREPSTEDKRQVFVRLTPEGKDMLRKLSSTHQHELNRIGPEISRAIDKILRPGEAR
jgi:DNA-binding MarR family transcriptional regulator